MAATGYIIFPMENSRNTLVYTQIDIRGGIGGDPCSSGANIYVRRNINHIVFFAPDAAFGNHTCKLPKNRGNRFGSYIVFIFTCANPTHPIIKMLNDSFHIIFAIVFVKKKAGQFSDSLYFLIPIKRLCHLLSLPFEQLLMVLNRY